jgi:alkanesulfonate monooxygenase SsuD/methylene tetrahydromethanopterin reductase-like flavin-dependent oxidoreductase (luciferase family)
VRDPLPILIGGGGEKVTLKIVAEHAHIWNVLGDPEQAGRKNRILDEWCQKVGRDPKEIVRSFYLRPHQVRNVDRSVENGITHLMIGIGGPNYDLSPLKELISWRDEYRERHPETADPARILLMNGF